MTKLRSFAVAAVAGLAAVSLAACANNSATPAAQNTAAAGGDSAITLVNPGKLTACTHLAFKPFQFKDDSGKIVGYEVDLMDLVAKDLGVEQEIVDIAFDQITSGSVFAAKKCDVGAAAITIREERAKAATFAEPHFDSTLALLVKSDSGITKVEDLKDKQVAVQTDTTGKDWAEENAAKYGYTTRVFDDMPTATNSVLGGVTVATINDNGVLYDFANDNPTTKVIQEFETGEQYGFNVSNDNKALATKINEVLDKARADGTFNEIYKKWFGVDAPAK
ncbi:transporter substrate-binding domain-containing protein [Propioniciclava sp. MC1595]|uniref:transporter substrate-binding domain-containing protein n=1 Tax=Propioniciclava sp. MC1595 TaxID=2760308 RepID=UPI001FB593FD|nr:transporter substrate-binding domain-containing protein [Propioniciclava sp. MC1595]